MRGPFDRLVDVFFGPTSATPGVPRAIGAPARAVPDNAFVDTAIPLSLSLVYLTIDFLQPNGPTVAPLVAQAFLYDYGAGDTVSLVTGTPATWQVVRVERRTWPVGPNYWRAHLKPITVVPPAGCSAYADIPGTYTLTRIGPTDWLQGTWSLTVDTLGNWTLHNSATGRTYTYGPWNGLGTRTFNPAGAYPGQTIFSIGPCP